MKNLFILSVLALGLISCGDTGREVEATDAQEVEVTESESATTYTTVKEGSYTDWRAAHFGGAEPRYGKIYLKTAEVTVNEGAVTNAKAVMDMTAITVENFGDDQEKTGKLTGHLKNEDFFNVEKYPTSTFELTSIEGAEGDFNSAISGNLTIMDSTKSITFNANITVSDEEVSIKSEDFAIDRRDWGLVYNMEGTEGLPVDYVIANDIGFTINAVLTK